MINIQFQFIKDNIRENER